MQSHRITLFNADMGFLNLITLKKYYSLIRRNKISILENTGLILRFSSGELAVPKSVILKFYVRVPYREKPRATRKMILERDNYTCRYCGDNLPKNGLETTVDHVLPKSRGGGNHYDNLVACCSPCNNKKADRTPEEANMEILDL